MPPKIDGGMLARYQVPGTGVLGGDWESRFDFHGEVAGLLSMALYTAHTVDDASRVCNYGSARGLSCGD